MVYINKLNHKCVNKEETISILLHTSYFTVFIFVMICLIKKMKGFLGKYVTFQKKLSNLKGKLYLKTKYNFVCICYLEDLLLGNITSSIVSYGKILEISKLSAIKKSQLLISVG